MDSICRVLMSTKWIKIHNWETPIEIQHSAPFSLVPTCLVAPLVQILTRQDESTAPGEQVSGGCSADTWREARYMIHVLT